MVGWLFDQLWIFLRCTLVMFRSWRSRYSKSTLFQTCSQHLLENCHSVAQHFLGVECEKLWLKTGVKDRAGFILIYSLQPSPGPLISKSLPAYHASAGCDTTSAFSGIGEKKGIMMCKWTAQTPPVIQILMTLLTSEHFLTEKTENMI